MSKRLYFLVPDVATCKAIVDELDEAGIPDSHTHVIGNHFTPLDGLHKASFLQKSEFTHGIEEGLGVGGAAGLVGGLLAVTFPPAGLVLGGGALLASALAGAGLGAVISGIVAKDIPSRKLSAFEDAINQGELLLLVDVPRRRVDELVKIIHKHHPEVEIGTTTPSPSLGKSQPA
uniref:DUF1269 domain-containing protein n=1 Tax=Candidatus Kentrum sp. LFY TaxID=2126342 RepID=A0A450X6E9_9GAMM|nr:MAG: hypothetical protein BECKLFY1418A_GA0070994_100553 [Candidatus Kentron sp. LFY]VFJ89288.1 MAG: hypothetical protein BECKLFY1418B_GA0070995_101436 [Candidatus Kentron sp. LFY]VFK24869.1 MAG: hypothetical protein BECKLFY1418C_GA0070996_11982 [Candidatus Kentron sp. LFY]